MTELDKKIKEYYNSKKISEAKIRNIQRKCMVDKRKSRFMFYGPIAAIFFVAIMSKIVFNIFQAEMGVPPPPQKQPPKVAMEEGPREEPRFTVKVPPTSPSLKPKLSDQPELAESPQAATSPVRPEGKRTVIELVKIKPVRAPDADKRNIIEVRAVILTAFPQFQKVYGRALKVSRIFQGKIQIEFTIDNAGRVRKADLITSELKYVDLEEGILDIVKKLKFPSSKHKDINYIVTLKFNPAP